MDLRNHNYRMYEAGKRSQEEYRWQRGEDWAYATITAAGNVAIYALCPPAGLAVAFATAAIAAIEECVILPQCETGAYVVEDIEAVYPQSSQIRMKGNRVIYADTDFVRALIELESEFDVGYRVCLGRA